MCVTALTDADLFESLRRAWPSNVDYADFFKEVRRRHRTRVRNIACRILQRFPCCVEEAEQEAWRRFHGALSTCHKGSEVAFLATVARTASIDVLRGEIVHGGWAQAREPRNATDAGTPAGPPQAGANAAIQAVERMTRVAVSQFEEHPLSPSQGMDPDKGSRLREVVRLLSDCASQLPDWRWKQAVYRVFVMGEQQGEVAAFFEVTTKTVRNWLHGYSRSKNPDHQQGALALLRRCLEEKGITGVKEVIDVR